MGPTYLTVGPYRFSKYLKTKETVTASESGSQLLHLLDLGSSIHSRKPPLFSLLKSPIDFSNHNTPQKTSPLLYKPHSPPSSLS
ncbi:hypothetical protein L1887_08598 [Cichorium endivia]|nr:hypothetical protein L1887_08598 [Cichorium endivia]